MTVEQAGAVGLLVFISHILMVVAVDKAKDGEDTKKLQGVAGVLFLVILYILFRD